MAMGDAFTFFDACKTDDSFRQEAYGFSGGEGFRAFIAGAGLAFTDAEAEDALRSLELRSADEYEAEEIKQLRQWYSLMAMSALPSSCASCRKSAAK